MLNIETNKDYYWYFIDYNIFFYLPDETFIKIGMELLPYFEKNLCLPNKYNKEYILKKLSNFKNVASLNNWTKELINIIKEISDPKNILYYRNKTIPSIYDTIKNKTFYKTFYLFLLKLHFGSIHKLENAQYTFLHSLFLEEMSMADILKKSNYLTLIRKYAMEEYYFNFDSFISPIQKLHHSSDLQDPTIFAAFLDRLLFSKTFFDKNQDGSNNYMKLPKTDSLILRLEIITLIIVTLHLDNMCDNTKFLRIKSMLLALKG